jgi:hypothetical protein
MHLKGEVPITLRAFQRLRECSRACARNVISGCPTPSRSERLARQGKDPIAQARNRAGELGDEPVFRPRQLFLFLEQSASLLNECAQ